jgi:hypothetical protein
MLNGKKTYIAAALLVVWAGTGWGLTALAPDVATQLGIHVDFGNVIELLLASLGLGGLRAAVAKS